MQRETVQKLHTEKTETEGKFIENIFPKDSFRTRMYNQLIKQSNSISKLCRDIKKSSEINQHKDFPVDKKFD
jgi:hypothetical protein